MKAILILLLAVFVVGAATAATAPTWVANEPGTGFVPVYGTGTVGDVRVYTLEVTTTSTAVEFSVWYYLNAGWTKSNPLNGAAAADTVLHVPANTTKAYRFVRGADGLYVSSGDAFFAGE